MTEAAIASAEPFVAPEGAGGRQIADSIVAYVRKAPATENTSVNDDVDDETDSASENADGETASDEANPADNPEGTGEEPEPEETDESDDQPEPVEPGEKPETHTVKIDGQDVSVTLDELKNGYSRTEDYKRKTARLAENERALDKERSELANQREQIDAKVEAVVSQAFELASEDMLLLMREKNTDWQKLAREDPTDWAARKVAHEAAQQRVGQVMAEKNRRAEEAKAKKAKESEAYIAEQRKLTLQHIPEFADDAKRDKLLGDMKEYLAVMGFDPEEIDGIKDHRLLRVARDAVELRHLKARQKAVEAKKTPTPAPKVISAKRSSGASEQSEREKALAKQAKFAPNLRERSEAALALVKLRSSR